MIEVPQHDIQTLAHLVNTTYLPKFKKDIENSQDEFTKDILEKRYKEVEVIVNKYLEE